MSSEEEMETIKKLRKLPKAQQRMLIAQSLPELKTVLKLIDRMEQNIFVVSTILMNVDDYKNQLEMEVMNLYKKKMAEIAKLKKELVKVQPFVQAVQIPGMNSEEYEL